MNKKTMALLLLLLGAFPALAVAQTTGDESLAMPVRGVWMHPAFFGPEKTAALEKIRATLDEYQKAGINTVIILVKDTSGRVYFKSRIGVSDPRWDWDFLAEFLAEAKRRDIQVHPWFCVFHETSLLGRVREHPEWL